ncbi:MAG: D-alanyl-D-alanine dipeptidase [Chlamydiia bacterium]|nr:D-alanyl-D-alanine dipeptidase [Chlamydiia bacterium]
MKDEDFIDIEKFCPSIRVDVLLSHDNNFIKKTVYPSAKCYLRRKVAVKLAQVQKDFEKLNLGLKITDGYRPLSVQKILWDFLPDDRYVAPPQIGSKHNRGAAVDVTLVDFEGNELDMGSNIDEMGEIAHRDYDNLPAKIIANRTLLEDVMVNSGFIPLPTEWWHFDDADWENYPLEDICIGELEKSESK